MRMTLIALLMGPATMICAFAGHQKPVAGVLSGSNSLYEANKRVTQSSPESVIEKTLRLIHSDLKGIKSEFPQLREIDQAFIENGTFQFQRGFLKDSKKTGARFEPNGCDIYVDVKYPATKDDIKMRQLHGDLFEMKNGEAFAVWRLVRAEEDHQGAAFTKRVADIVSERLADMEKTLQHDPR